jgi:uncharacterized protein (DUF983 family)
MRRRTYVCPGRPIRRPDRKDRAMPSTPIDAETPARGQVSIFEAMKRGFAGRCPHCGQGRLFRAFLKVADRCPTCGEEMHHHRADDFPAYIVIVIVGHLLVPLVLAVETHFAPPYWLHMVLWPVVTAGLALSLLQPVKGAIVGLQWAAGMHGFEEAKKARVAAAGVAGSTVSVAVRKRAT